jgi:hypothetical protein
MYVLKPEVLRIILTHSQQAAYASDILYITTLFLSKLSTAFLFLRLTPGRGHSIAIWSTLCTCIAWAFISILLVALRCHPAHPWLDTTTAVCSSLFTRWQFIAALDILTEASLFSISLYLIWRIQMSIKSKTVVVIAFGCRLPYVSCFFFRESVLTFGSVIALSALRLYYLHQQLTSSNPTLHGGPAAVSITQIELGYSILASIVPCLKNFMAAYDAPVQSGNWYQHYTDNTGYTHELTSVASKSVISKSEKGGKSDVNVSRDTEGQMEYAGGKKGGGAGMLSGGLGRLRPEQIRYEAKVTHREPEAGREEGETRSVDSGNSRRMIIKKGVEWSVDYDSRPAESAADEEN